MAGVETKISEITSLEALSGGSSAVHRLHPRVKFFTVIIFILVVISFGRHSAARLAPFFLFITVAALAAELPLALPARRSLVALPFCLFAGVASLWYEPAVAFHLFSYPVTEGLLSLITLTAKAMLTVAAVSVFVAVTPFTELSRELRCLGFPTLFVTLLELLYRYTGVLTEQTMIRAHAMALRGGSAGGLTLSEMGPLLGQLMLSSSERAGRLSDAMRCRGWDGTEEKAERMPLSSRDSMQLLALTALLLLFRAADIPALLVQFAGGVL